MQFKAAIPDQGTSTTVLWEVQVKGQGGTPSSHRKHHAPALHAHCLCGPVDGIEALRLPGVLHAHLGMRGAQFAGGFDGGKEGMYHHLHRLTMQSKASLGCLLQFVASRPHTACLSCRFMEFTTGVPHL